MSRDRIAESVERSMDMDMDRRAAQSMFDQSTGQLNARAAASAGTVSLGEYLDLTLVPWAPEPDGGEHCQNLARLVEYMGALGDKFGGLGPFEPGDCKILYATAMLYCTGMQEPTSRIVPWRTGYEPRSAFLAEQFFRNGGGQNTYWSKPEVREETCRLIFRHNDPRAIESDPRLKVFADARRYELSRHEPNDPAGFSMEMLQREWVPDLFHTGWAKSKDNARGWMLINKWS